MAVSLLPTWTAISWSIAVTCGDRGVFLTHFVNVVPSSSKEMRVKLSALMDAGVVRRSIRRVRHRPAPRKPSPARRWQVCRPMLLRIPLNV
jgi:hypothetical protein